MRDGKKITLAVNPGSTSMKIALYADRECRFEQNLKIDLMSVVENFDTYEMTMDSSPMKLVTELLSQKGYETADIDAVATRGGPAMPMKSGAYHITDLYLYTFRYAPKVKHPSILGPAMARCIGDAAGAPAIVYDSDSVDEAGEMEHLTGIPEIRRTFSSHLLNGKMMCFETAEKLGKRYDECNFAVAHVGGGISVAAHERGHVIDSLFVDDGPITPTRCGILPVRQLVHLCYSGKYTEKEMQRFIISNGGLTAYFGTSDAREIEKMIEAGDERAKQVYRAMVYSTARCIGQMAVALKGELDAIIITGGLAHSQMVCGWLKEWTGFLAPVHILPGEEEMKALCLGALRVIEGEEGMLEYDFVPEGYETVEEFYKTFNIKA